MQVIQSDGACSSAAFFREASARVIDKNPTHHLSGNSKKLRAVFPTGIVLIDQSDVDLVYKRRRLKRVSD